MNAWYESALREMGNDNGRLERACPSPEMPGAAGADASLAIRELLRMVLDNVRLNCQADRNVKRATEG